VTIIGDIINRLTNTPGNSVSPAGWFFIPGGSQAGRDPADARYCMQSGRGLLT